jgi:sugar lactone lactonase YvrE
MRTEGITFDADGNLFVSALFNDADDQLLAVSTAGTFELAAEAGTPEKWVSFDDGTTPDGVAIDSEGNVYVALNLVSQIAQVDPEGTVTIIAENVHTAASLAFGQGDFDPCSIYATSLLGTQLWRVGIGILGTEK